MKKKELKRLIERLVSASNSGTYTYSDDVYCYFCKEEEGRAHKKDCPYVEALRILGKADDLTCVPIVRLKRLVVGFHGGAGAGSGLTLNNTQTG